MTGVECKLKEEAKTCHETVTKSASHGRTSRVLAVVFANIIIFQTAMLVLHECRINLLEKETKTFTKRCKEVITDIKGQRITSIEDVLKKVKGEKGATGDMGAIGPLGRSVQNPRIQALLSLVQGEKGARGEMGAIGPPGRSVQRSRITALLTLVKGEKGAIGPPGRSVQIPRITQRPFDKTVLQGSTVTFYCKAEGYPKPNIKWELNSNKWDVLRNKRIKLLWNGGIAISDAKANDSGIIRCIAENTLGKQVADARLTIHYVSVVVEPRNVLAYPGDTIHITCNATGNPRPRVQWRRVDYSSWRQYKMPATAIIVPGKSLTIKNITVADSGVYRCVAEITATRLISSAVVVVGAKKPRNCMDILSIGSILGGYRYPYRLPSGVYKLWWNGLTSYEAYCDLKTDDGGWTVFQRRQVGKGSFNRGWNDYKNGFGKANGSFWLGLDKIHAMTSKGVTLRVDLEEFDGTKGYAKYGTFEIGDESTNYTIKVSGFSGNIGDSLSSHNNMQFSTMDRDNDQYGGHCSSLFQAGWWYKSCYSANLNGLDPQNHTVLKTYMCWYEWKSSNGHIKFTEMKFR